jgi:hypothetical protein
MLFNMNVLQNISLAFWLPLVAGIGMVLLGLFESDKSWKFRIGQLMVGIFALGGSYFVAIDQREADALARKQTIQIQSAQAELKAKTDHIANLNNEIKGFITGGDSYCFLHFRNVQSIFAPGNIERRIDVVIVGEYPLHDVRVEVYDLYALAEIGDKVPHEQLQKKSRKIDSKFGILTKSTNMQIFSGGFPWPKTGLSGRYIIIISASNGNIYQEARAEKVNDMWCYAWRVFRDSTSGYLLQNYADPEFPRNAEGKIEWWDSPISGANQFHFEEALEKTQ